MYKPKERRADFEQLQRVLDKKAPSRPVLFEFIIGDAIKGFLTDGQFNKSSAYEESYWTMRAFHSGGYDFSPVILRGMEFPRGDVDDNHETKSLNEGGMIKDRSSFDRYAWPSIDGCDFSLLDRLAVHLPEDMLFVAFSHDGILENTIGIVGYEQLCLMLYDDPGLVADIFYAVGACIKDYYVRCLEREAVGAVLLNDDWGFKSQTMLPPEVLRKHVFPWYEEVAHEAHKRKKHVILHSCGHYEAIIDDIIDVMDIDGRHSYEDNIDPVEQAYDRLKGRIAVIGGMDVDFLCRSTPEEIRRRASHMLEKSGRDGGYALGSGNSVPDYVPLENYLAMLDAAFEYGKDE